ncbi:DegV family protein [Paraeggerthella hominis]|uniref:DegV family protein n=1 Tax=Paraeggerthella hominis TaxID=2897351 RepID=UPI003D0C6F46
MSMNFEIVTDSSSNLVEEMIDDFGLHVLPLTFMVDGEDEVYQSYLKGEHIDLSQFYTMMREGKVFKTSLPNLADTEQLMRGLLEQGRDVLYLGFSSGLSGTYEAVELLVGQLAGEFPDRTVLSVDTLAASGGEGLLVWHAVQRARAGAAIEEVRDWVEANKLKLAHWFTVDDLMFLFRGGRVSKTSAWAGTMLNIKPVMHVDDDGHLVPMEKVRGRKKSLNALVDHMEKTAIKPIEDQMVFITHGDCLEDAEYVAAQVKERFGVRDVVINYVDPVIGAHSGPGTMALFFLADKR